MFDDEVDPVTGSAVQQATVLLDRQEALLVSVATGGPPIKDMNQRYKDIRRQLLVLLRPMGLEYPFPFADLWEWHGYWKQLNSYALRRDHIAGLARDVRDALESRASGLDVHDPGSPAAMTWPALELRVAGVVGELQAASSKDDLQDVGRRCREILIDVARLLADPALVPEGQDPPKAGDAKGWLDLFLQTRASGRSHNELRTFLPAAWALAQKVTHGDIERVDAYAAAQATVLLVRTLQMLASD